MIRSVDLNELQNQVKELLPPLELIEKKELDSNLTHWKLTSQTFEIGGLTKLIKVLN